MGFPDSSVGKESAYNAGDLGSIPGLGRSPGEGNTLPAWRIPWGCRVGHDWATFTSLQEGRKQNSKLWRTIIIFNYVPCLIAQSCPALCGPMDCNPPGSSVHGDSPGKNTGVGCHALFQRIFPTQESNSGLLQCRWILHCLRHQGSPSKVWDKVKHWTIEKSYIWRNVMVTGLFSLLTIVSVCYYRTMLFLY